MVAIQEHGWNPLNHSLLDGDDIKLTMTNSDIVHYKSIHKLEKQCNIVGTEASANTIVGSISTSTSTKTVSKLSGPNLNYDPKFLSVNAPMEEVSVSSKMNFKSGHS